MNHSIKRLFAISAALVLFGGGFYAEASQVDILIEKLVENGMLTRLDAETVRTEIETAEKISYIEHRDQTNPWLEGLTQKGDIRLRTEGFSYDESNKKDRHRQRVRLRWGVEKKFNEEWKAGFRISTGPSDEAVSTNQSLDDEFGFKNLWVNRAYGIYTPTARVQEMLPGVKHVEIGAGKVANPYSKWGTSIVWDGDVEPEGIYEAVDFHLADLDNDGSLTLKTLLGQWVLEEQSTKKDVDMQSFGIGAKAKFDKKGKTYLWANYVFYNWEDYDKVLTAGAGATTATGFDASALGTDPAGNSRFIDGFNIHSIYAEYGMPVDTVVFGNQPFKIFGHWLQNDADNINSAVLSMPAEDKAWSAGIQLSKAKKKGTWQAKWQYFWIEANSTVGNFSESDLGSGGTNNAGHLLQYKYQITDKIQLAWSNWFAEPINDTTGLTTNDTVWRTQADLVFKF